MIALIVILIFAIYFTWQAYEFNRKHYTPTFKGNQYVKIASTKEYKIEKSVWMSEALGKQL